MTLLLLEGFEVNRVNSWLDTKYTRGGSTVNSSGVPGRKHGFSQVSNGSNTTLDYEVTARDRFVFGAGVLAANVNLHAAWDFRKNNVMQLQLGFIDINNDQDNQIRVTNGTTNWDGPALNRNRWYYIEMEATIHPTTGSFTVWVDGVQVMNETGIDTAGEGTAQADEFRMRVVASERMDDVYLLDDQGSDNARLGPIVIEGHLPNADGVQNDWIRSGGSSNFEQVNDSATQGSVGTDRVTADQVGLVDVFEFGNLSQIDVATEIYALELTLFHAMDGSGNRDIAPRFRDSGGGTSTGATRNVTGTVLSHSGEIYRQNPVTAVPWTPATIAVGQWGIESV